MLLKNFTNLTRPRMLGQARRFLVLALVVTGTQVLGFSAGSTTLISSSFVNGENMAATITGVITDASGSPLPGVNILVKGTSTGTTSDANGNFTIEADAGDILVFSFIGYVTKEVAVDGGTTLNVQLEEDVMSLDAVVVTALGIQRQPKELVYATQSVEAAELAEVRDPNNILNSFRGRIANAVINQSSNGVGSAARIVLRGNRSVNGDNNALIVVDGVPFSSSITTINPDDIESINVLRGPSAAALYGSQAGNGVIVITTKTGEAGRVSVTVNSGLTLETPFSLPRFQNTYGQGSAGQLTMNAGESWGARMDGQTYTNHLGEERSYSPQPDNVRDFFGTGTSFRNSIALSGGAENMQTYLSYTNNQVDGIIPNNELKSHTINLRMSNKISERFSTDAKLTYFMQDIYYRPRYGEGNTPALSIYQIPRSLSTADAERYETVNGVGVLTPEAWPTTNSAVYGNPYWVVNRDINDEFTKHLVGLFSAKYKITEWLDITGRANLDILDRVDERKTYQSTLSWSNTTDGGEYFNTASATTNQWFDLMLTGKNALNQDLSLNYTVGAIYQDNKSESVTGQSEGLVVANKFSLAFAKNPRVAQTGSQVKTQSVFGQFNFGYKNAIFVEGSLRNDWDSRLPSPYAYQYYSIGASGVISDMVTLPEVISFLKLNVNYAEVGNGGRFGVRSSSYGYQAGVGSGYLRRSLTAAIPNLKPELNKSSEVGLEARFIQNKYGVSVTYYKSNALNQLLTVNMPAGTGFTSQFINAGNIQNQGVEVMLNAMPIMTDRLEWSVDFNLGINRNKVLELTEDMKIVYLGSHADWGGRAVIEEGGAYGDIEAYQWKRNEQGQLLVTDAGVPLTTKATGEVPEYIGNVNPKATMGLSNTLRRGNLSLRVLVDGRVGGIVISGTEQNLSHSGLTEATEKFREGGWHLGGVNTEGEAVDATITAQQFWETASNQRSGTGEFFAYDATNFRMREVALGYTFNIASNSFVKRINISLVGRNLFWIYRGSSLLDIPGLGKRKMWFDPDMSNGSGNNQGVEYGSIPSTRSVGLNLNLSI